MSSFALVSVNGRKVERAYAIVGCPNCKEPMKAGFHEPMGEVRHLTVWWECDSSAGCGDQGTVPVPFSNAVGARAAR